MRPTFHSSNLSSLLRGAVLGAALAVCGTGFAANAPVQVENAWIRWLPANLPAGGYMQLHNTSAQAQELSSASSPDYGEVMLHQTVRQPDGMMQMTHVDKVVVPAHGSAEFKPGGYHIMLMQPKKQVQPGDHVPVTLHFVGGASVTAEFEVRKADAGAMPGMNMQGGQGH